MGKNKVGCPFNESSNEGILGCMYRERVKCTEVVGQKFSNVKIATRAFLEMALSFGQPAA